MSEREALARRLGERLRGFQRERRLPSVSAAVGLEGEPLWREAVGLADIESERAATPDTQYRVGSITKSFVAVTLLQLCAEGRLDLDERLDAHLDLARGEGLTLRRLLSHLSGLQREIPGSGWETLVLPEADELLERLGEAERVLAPAEAWHYSNLAYAALRQLVGRLRGAPCERVIEQRLLAPLALARTGWQAVAPAAVGYLVEPYAERVRREPDLDLRGARPAGGLWSTVSDLVRYGDFLARGDERLLGREWVERMASVQTMVDERAWTQAWGLGLALFRRGERVLAGHEGGMPGHVAVLLVSPSERLACAVLVNATVAPGLVHLCADLLLDACELAVEPPAWRPGGPPPAELEPVLGRWWAEGSEWIFRWSGEELLAEPAAAAPGAPPTVFRREGPDRYRVLRGSERGERLEIVRDPSGAVSMLRWATYPFHREPRVFGAR